jgi:DNA-binding winged helix-turn-helix (wHTH) protein
MDGIMPRADLPSCGYWFAGFRLEPEGTLLRGETPIELSTDELAALRLLLERAGEFVSPIELRRALWGEEQAAGNSVAGCIAALRAHLSPEDCIEEVYRRGYRVSVIVQPDSPPRAGTLPRLAIVPFTADLGAPEYLALAATEEIMERLDNPRGAVASVLARDSVFTLAQRGLGAREIGDALHADLVLRGILRSSDGHYRIRAEMIRVEDGAQLWIEDLLVSNGCTAGLGSELAKRVAFRLQDSGLSISAAAGPVVGRAESRKQNGATELYLRAHYEWQSLERHRMQDATAQLEQAIELDPSLEAARVDLAHLCVAQALLGFIPAKTAAGVARRAAVRAPDSAKVAEELLPALGWISFHVDHDLRAALRNFAGSAHLRHSLWTTRLRMMLALSRHRFDEALGLLHATIQVDPYSPWLQAELGWALHLAGEADASVDQARKAIDIFPDHYAAPLYGAMILAYNGEIPSAERLTQELVARLPHFDVATAVRAYVLARAGRAEEARDLLERLEWLTRERFVLRAFNATAYAALGEIDRALIELQASMRDRCPWFFQMLADPRMRQLQGRPEFEAMRAALPAMEAETNG